MSGHFHISIDYDEGDPKSYRGVVAKLDGEEHRRWSTGDPQADWAAYVAWGREFGARVVLSSSITHFLWDVPGWRMIEDGNGHEIITPEDRPHHLLPVEVDNKLPEVDPDDCWYWYDGPMLFAAEMEGVRCVFVKTLEQRTNLGQQIDTWIMAPLSEEAERAVLANEIEVRAAFGTGLCTRITVDVNRENMITSVTRLQIADLSIHELPAPGVRLKIKQEDPAP